VPIGLVSLALVYRNLHIPHTRRDHRIDYWAPSGSSSPSCRC
jgi:hypothetical protein